MLSIPTCACTPCHWCPPRWGLTGPGAELKLSLSPRPSHPTPALPGRTAWGFPSGGRKWWERFKTVHEGKTALRAVKQTTLRAVKQAPGRPSLALTPPCPQTPPKAGARLQD